MKKIISILTFLANSFIFAQIGIGVSQPQASSILDLTSTDKALLLPRVPNTGSISTPANGMLIYDISAKCIKGYQNDTWTSCLSLPTETSSITSLNCNGTTNTGNLIENQAANAVSSSIPYTGGNGSAHNGQTVNSIGVTGLTAKLLPGSFATGTGTLVYTISGTPQGYGTAGFAINIGGKTCTLILSVSQSSIPLTPPISGLYCSSANHTGTIIQNELAVNSSSSIPYTEGNGSAYASQSVNSTGVTGLIAMLDAGNFAIGNGNLTYQIIGLPNTSGTANFAINIGGKTCTLTRQVVASGTPPTGPITSLNCGTASHSGTIKKGEQAVAASSIQYTGGNGSAYVSQSVNSTGVTGLIAILDAGNFATGNGTLTYTIIGIPQESGTASFSISVGGKTCTFTREVLPSAVTPPAGVCGAYINGVFREFACFNLGATPTAGQSPFVPKKNIYGAKYRWGEKVESVSQSMDQDDYYKPGIPTWPSNPNVVNSVINWQDPPTIGPKNPCPTNYRVPTRDEWQAVLNENTLEYTAGTWWADEFYERAVYIKTNGVTTLMLPGAGSRGLILGERANVGQYGFYWSSTAQLNTIESSYGFSFRGKTSSNQPPIAQVGWDNRNIGKSVRCIKNY